jgi:hypothetical protein
MKMRTIALVALLVFLSTPAGAQDPQRLIMPGVGIGPLVLGMNITDVVKVMGTPKFTQARANGVVYAWFEHVSLPSGRAKGDGGLYALCTETGEVVRVGAYLDNRYKTTEGLGVGSSDKEVRKALGDPTRTRQDTNTHYLDYPGVMFRIVDDLAAIGYPNVDETVVVKREQ